MGLSLSFARFPEVSLVSRYILMCVWLRPFITVLGVIGRCRHRHNFKLLCNPKHIRAVLFVGVFDARESLNAIPVPSVVRHEGGHKLEIFEQGSRVFISAGCLACHRIGRQGKSGPGPNLSSIGAKLSTRELEQSITNPSAPMPSFNRLPREKLAALIAFLSTLNRPGFLGG
jgi:cytochrome c553